MAYAKPEIENIFRQICERIAEGESLRSVCRDEKMPVASTFFKWIDEDENKKKQYARATTLRHDYLFEEILTIADKQDKDVKIIDGVEVVDHNVIQRNRLQIDSRKWALSKMNPKKYGEKVDITTDGEKISDNFFFISDDFNEQ